MQLSAIHVYPVKSGAALCPGEALLEARGLAHDRRWMVVDATGRFLTGRQLPQLVRLRATPHEGGLWLDADGRRRIDVALPAADAPRMQVTVWKSQVDAARVDPAVDAWLSEWLGRDAHLVHMDAIATRPVRWDGAEERDEVGFADGFPLLLVSQASLDGLNARLSVPLPMLRFRPNLVIEGADAAHAEDGWRRLRIGGIEFIAARPCVRCVFTTVDPERGAFDPSGEPLATLKSYRRSSAGITFGMNLLARGHGRLRIGDEVTVLE